MSKSSLTIEYKNNLSIFKENCTKDINEWLEYVNTFSRGKQGLVGLLKLKENSNVQYVFKVSQYINYLVEHESIIMKGLNELSYVPHYCKVYGCIKTKINPQNRKEGNPFDLNCDKTITKNVLLMEHLTNAPKFYSYIKSDKISEEIIYSTIKQVLMAVSIAQEKKKLTHYDLHSNNVLMKRCDKDLVFLYVIDEKTQFLTPTHGHYPVIIDYGFSFIENCNDEYLWASLGHTEVGFLSDRFDWVADPKLFLVSVSNELKIYRNNKKSRKFRTIVKNMFHPLNIEWDCGWDATDKYSTSDYLAELLDKYTKRSEFFRKMEPYCLDILQSLIILPLQEQRYDSLLQAYNAFLDEFIKIEDQIGNHFYLLYVLQSIVNCARKEQMRYHYSDTREEALSSFKYGVYSCLDEVAKFCRPKNINFEKMLCSLLVLGKCIEGVYYFVMENKSFKKEQEYSKLPLKSVNQIYSCLDVNLPDKYEYNDNTVVFMLNCNTSKCIPFKLSKSQIRELNSIHSLSRGTYLYDSIKGMKI